MEAKSKASKQATVNRVTCESQKPDLDSNLDSDLLLRQWQQLLQQLPLRMRVTFIRVEATYSVALAVVVIVVVVVVVVTIRRIRIGQQIISINLNKTAQTIAERASAARQ